MGELYLNKAVKCVFQKELQVNKFILKSYHTRKIKKKNYRDIKKKASKLMKRSGNVSKTKIHKRSRKTLGKYAKRKAVGLERK